METKLNADEIRALQSLEPESPKHVRSFREGDFPQRLFAYNLVSRQPSGRTVLTTKGRRVLFQQACICALEAAERVQPSGAAADVYKWLFSSGFVERNADGSGAPAITRRGRMWLESGKDDPVTAERELTAEDFERRRA